MQLHIINTPNGVATMLLYAELGPRGRGVPCHYTKGPLSTSTSLPIGSGRLSVNTDCLLFNIHRCHVASNMKSTRLWNPKVTLDRRAPSYKLWIGYLVHWLDCHILFSASRCKTANLHWWSGCSICKSVKTPKNPLNMPYATIYNTKTSWKMTWKM